MNAKDHIYELDRHEVLQGSDWCPLAVKEVVVDIVKDAERTFSRQFLWPRHPVLHQVPDDLCNIYDDNFDPELWFTGIYSGASGVILGLRYIDSRLGSISPSLDLNDMMEATKFKYFEVSGNSSVPSYFFGDSGIYFSDWVINKTESSYDLLIQTVKNNLDLPSNELFWGTPGLMIVCLHMYELSKERIWVKLFVRLANKLWSKRVLEKEFDCELWVQYLDKCYVMHLGAGHGFAGNVHALLRGGDFIDTELKEQVQISAIKTLHQTLIRDQDGINWPQSIVRHRPQRTAKLMQWCHGAPGIITALKYCSGIDNDLDDLLVQVGETVWHAGPLSKSLGGICHSTAGNGYAFLSLYERTGDEKWLARARLFAMESIKGFKKAKYLHGQSKYSLWTGDIGIACYLTDCLKPSSGIPTLDII